MATRSSFDARGRGTSLPADVVRPLEALLGADLSRVLVHTSEAPLAMGALAFARGEHVYVAPHAFAPGTREGIRLLAHELTHVVQQRRGRLGAVCGDGIHWDASLEAEADVVGDHAAALFDGAALPSSPVIATTIAGAPSIAVQCLMSLADFKTSTNVTGKRDKIAAVDAALTAFHALDAQTPRNYTAILAQIRALYQACKQYHVDRPGSGRASGVNTLMRQIAFEEVILTALADAYAATDLVTKWDHIDECLARYIKIKDRAELKRSVWNELDSLINSFSSISATPITEQIVKKDIAALEALTAKADIPDILRHCIREMTDAKTIRNLDLTVWLPGAKYNGLADKSVNKYTLKHHLSQSNGKYFRLGSLLHELTHVSIAESYDNGPLMLAISTRATDREILTEATLRRGKINELKTLLGQMSATAMPPWLKNEMIGKAGYPLSGKLGTYLANFKKKMSPEEYERLSKLCAQGLDCELIEYDTVINQMAMWCYLYNVPRTNEAYRLLLSMAERAYAQRLEARGAVRRGRSNSI